MDASKLGEKRKVDGKNQRTFLNDDEIERIVGVFNAAEVQDDFSVQVPYGDIAAKGYSFSAGQYFEVKIDYVDLTPEEFNTELEARMTRLRELFAEGDRLQDEIERQLKQVRFDG